MTSSPGGPTELQLSLRVQGGSLRSPRAARSPAGPALLSPPRSSPAGARAARYSNQPPDAREGVRRGWDGRIHGSSHLPVRVPRRARLGGHLRTLRAGRRPDLLHRPWRRQRKVHTSRNAAIMLTRYVALQCARHCRFTHRTTAQHVRRHRERSVQPKLTKGAQHLLQGTDSQRTLQQPMMEGM